MRIKFKGELIRTFAKRDKISITKLAEMIGVSRMSIYRWIDDKSVPPSNYLIMICDIFNENPHNFFEKTT